MIANETVTVRATVSFPSLVEEIRFKGAPTGKFGLQLANLSGPAVEKLEELGIEIKQKEGDAYERGHLYISKKFKEFYWKASIVV